MNESPNVSRESFPNSLLEFVRQHTTARILVGRSGGSYPTRTHLELRRDHAVAKDAVWDDVDLQRDLPGLDLIESKTCVRDKQEYLLRPDLGQELDAPSRCLLADLCPRDVDLQIVIGDGLSAKAIVRQVPSLLPPLISGAKSIGWSIGLPFFVRYCRVGILNAIGELLNPRVVVLLIGERPGLATAESLSAYFAYRPRPGHTNAQRNLISNIHDRGVNPREAVVRILELAQRIRNAQTSGVDLKETVAMPIDRITAGD